MLTTLNLNKNFKLKKDVKFSLKVIQLLPMTMAKKILKIFYHYNMVYFHSHCIMLRKAVYFDT